LALDGGEWSASCPGYFHPWRKTLWQLGPQNQSGHSKEKNILPLPGFELLTTHPVT